MELDLLTTKVQIPPAPQHAIHRKRLIDTLEHAIPRYKLILLSAPAGYGKTTLLAQWANMSQFSTAWLSLSEDDNDLERFLRYLLAAWETVQPRVRESKLGILLEAMSPDAQTVLRAFINVANKLADDLVLILDDYHLIDDPAIYDALSFLIDHQPPALHVVFAGRGEPPLPLARYRARGELQEYHVNDLKFMRDETQAFITRVMGLDLAQDQIASLQAQSEGWAAGLQLVALSLQRQLADVDPLIVSGRHRFIVDYLSEDVLAPLEPGTRQFLLQTSILDRLCASLCNAVTGKDHAQTMLEKLEGASLFLVPLDDRRKWFRYHQLFGEFLRQELQTRHPDQVAELHRRAAHWHLEQDLPELAFTHAVHGGAVEIVTRILDRYLVAKLLGGEIRVVARWLESLPEAWHSRYPMIAFARAGLLLATGQFDTCARYLDEIEQRITGDAADLHPARVTAMRCNIACFQNDLERAKILAEQALRNLPEDDLDFRAGVFGALGDTYRRNGFWHEAQECYLKLLNYEHARFFYVEAVQVFGALADLALRQGHLRDAAGYWRRAQEAIEKPENRGTYPLPLIGWVYIRLGELHYERDQLAEAWGHVSRGLERAELGGDVRSLIAGYLVAGRVKLTEGDVDAAADFLDRARPHVETAHFSHWASQFERLQLELWLAQDRLRAAANWSDRMLQDAAVEARPKSEVAQLATARVLLVQGDSSSIERALGILARLLEVAEREGRMGITIEGLALQALAHWKQGKRADALTRLERALRLAEPEGYVRLFADLGLPMARLLQQARSRQVMPEYVETLLSAFRIDLAFPAEDQHLPEPLTAREQEILQLVAAGLTNQEIADQLTIAPTTVKKHVSNILGKLAATNRTEAIARARMLDLLG